MQHFNFTKNGISRPLDTVGIIKVRGPYILAKVSPSTSLQGCFAELRKDKTKD